MSDSRLNLRNRLYYLIFIALFVVPLSFETANAVSIYSENLNNINIPDNTGAWATSEIVISGAPAGATVTGIDVYFKAIHTYSGDLNIDLRQGTDILTEHLWSNEGDSADNPTRTLTSISTFNGKSVNGTWKLMVIDTSSQDTGFIDEWSMIFPRFLGHSVRLGYHSLQLK